MVKRVLLHLLVISFLVALISCPSPVSVSQPKAPTGMTAAAESQTAITVQWTDTNAGKAAYRLERSTIASMGFVLVTATTAGATSYSDTGLSASTIYYYRVAAVLGTQTSAYGSTVSTSTASPPLPTAPAAPSGLVATATSGASVTLAWVDNAEDETGFTVTRCLSPTDPSPVNLTSGSPLSANQRTFVDTSASLQPATQYGYTVAALNSAGTSKPSNLVWTTTLSKASVASPSGILASEGVFGSDIFVDWTAGSVSVYRVYESGDANGYYTFLGPVSQSYAWMNNSISNVHDFFEVSAVDPKGNETSRSTSAEGWAGTYIFDEGFEAEAAAGRLQGYWTASNSTLKLQFVSPGANRTAGCLQLSGSGGSFSGVYANINTAAQPSTIGFWVNVKSTAAPTQDVALFAVSNNSKKASQVLVDLTAANKIDAMDLNSKLWGNFSYTTNTWYYVELRNINLAAHTFDFYISGNPMATNVALNASLTDMGYFWLCIVDANAVVQWDEVLVQ
jgi:hypothetical protein